MVRTTAGVAALAAVLTAGAAARVDAAPGPERVVVLHVANSTHVSRGDLAEAEQEATQVYHAAGVRVVWTEGAARTAQPDGAFQVDVVLLSRDRVARKSQSEGIGEQVFGTASRPIRRAYIFYDRIADHARLTGSKLPLLLGAVIAHEVGHLLLPAFRHSSSGIMRASWEVRMVRVPGFTGDQGSAMRSLLAAASGN